MRTPSIAWGRATDQMWKPKSRTERAWTKKAPGSLSTETVPQGSKAPKAKLCQFSDMLRTAPA